MNATTSRTIKKGFRIAGIIAASMTVVLVILVALAAFALSRMNF